MKYLYWLSVIFITSNFYFFSPNVACSSTVVSLTNQLKHTQKEKVLANLEAREKINAKQTKLNMLTVEIKNQRNTTYVLITSLILIIIISIIIYRLYYKLLNAHRKLVEQQLDFIQAESHNRQLINKISINDHLPVAEAKTQTKIEEEETNPPFELMAQIIHLMENEKLFLNPKLTIEELAKQLKTNKTYLSQIINTYFQKNFNNMVNEYRIHEILIWMTNRENANLSFEGMAFKAGFYNRTTFYEAFKHFTGVTPSFFLANIKRGEPP